MMEKYAQVTKLRNAECVSADGWSGLAVKSLQTEETTKKDLHNIAELGYSVDRLMRYKGGNYFYEEIQITDRAGRIGCCSNADDLYAQYFREA